jgi:hypothetical protein
MANNTIEKRADLVSKWWTRPIDQYYPLRANDNGLYLLDIDGTVETVLETVAYNVTLGSQILNATVKWTDAEGNPYIRLGYSADVTSNGSLAILINAQGDEGLGWYHTLLKLSGSASTAKLLNATWSNVRMKWVDDSKIYVAGYVADQGVSVAIFNTTQLSLAQSSGTTSTETTTSTSTQTTGRILGPEVVMAVAAGVIVFDVILIIFLKKKVAY